VAPIIFGPSRIEGRAEIEVGPSFAEVEVEPLRSLPRPKPRGMKFAGSSIFNTGAGHNALVEVKLQLISKMK
jgi:hypothetical protein